MRLLSALARRARKAGRPGPGEARDIPAEALATFRGGANCTQAVLCAFADRHSLDREAALRIGGAFGAGMNMGETCGAVTGALMVVGLRHARVAGAGFVTRERTEREAAAFVERFKARNGTVLCRELLGCDLGTPEGRAAARRDRGIKARCPKFVRDAAEILVELDRG